MSLDEKEQIIEKLKIFSEGYTIIIFPYPMKRRMT